MAEPGPYDLTTTYLRIRPDATVEPLPVDASFWQRLVAGELGTFANEFLLSHHTFDTDWDSWEVHPNGDEIVCLLAGNVTMVLESPDGERTIPLGQPGAFIIVPRGTWHTARVNAPSRMLFITAGEGTEHREG